MDTKHEFDSPYLAGELFSEETRDEAWVMRSSELDLLTPFQSAFEMPETPMEEPESLEEAIFPENERRPVVTKGPLHIRKTADVPWRWICNIALLRHHEVEKRSTGVLITDRHVLTAAHVVDKTTTDPAVYSLRVTPALDDGGEPFGRYLVDADKTKIPRYYQDALKNQDRSDALKRLKTTWNWDYALLTLRERVGKEVFPSLGNRSLCYWGHPSCGSGTAFSALHATAVERQWAVTAGYPEGKGGEQLWSAAGPVHPVPTGVRTMRFDAPTGKGWSGSPVWLVRNRRRCLVGIVVRAHEVDGRITATTAVRVTQDFVRQIATWIRADGDTPRWLVCAPDAEAEGLREVEPYNFTSVTKSFPEQEWEESADTESPPERLAERPEPHDEEPNAIEDLDSLTGEETDEGPADESPDHDQEVDHEFETPFFVQMMEILRKGDVPAALKLAIDAGTHDETKLTNFVFSFRHPELKGGKLDPQHPKFKQLSREWTRIRDGEVARAIQQSARDTVLAVSGKDVTGADRHFRGRTGKRFKTLVEQAAKDVDVHPALLAAVLIAETGRLEPYLRAGRVRSYEVGVDDYFERHGAIQKRVPAHAKVGWDRDQTPIVHPNDAIVPRDVRTIFFDSGPDGLLAGAVYMKYVEVRLREFAAKAGGDFDTLPLETRWALIRFGFNGGLGREEIPKRKPRSKTPDGKDRKGARPRLLGVLDGEDFLIRDWSPRRIHRGDRNAAIHTARAIHIADWIFGMPVDPTSTKPELESPEDVDEFYEDQDLESDDYSDELDSDQDEEFAESWSHDDAADRLEDMETRRKQRPPPRTRPGQKEVKINQPAGVRLNLTVLVLPDNVDPSLKSPAKTRCRWSREGWNIVPPAPVYEPVNGAQVLKRLDKTPEATATLLIQTSYKRRGFEKGRSAYGRGTTKDDVRDGNTSVGFHEWCHRMAFIDFLGKASLPGFLAVEGMTAEHFDAEWNRFVEEFRNLPVVIASYSGQVVDEVGLKKSEWESKKQELPTELETASVTTGGRSG